MRKLIAVLLVTIMVISATACSSASEGESRAIKVGLITTSAGLGDKSLNDGGYDGLTRAEEDFGITVDYIEPKAVSDYEMQISLFASSEEYDLIIGMGNDMMDAMKSVASDYPDQKFTVLDSESDVENIRGIYVKQQEQLFLAGVLAGLVTQDERMEMANADSNKVGTFIGMEIPNVLDAVAGYKAGVGYVNPEAEVFVKVAGSWVDAALGKTLAVQMNSNNADVIVQMAGMTGMGLFTAAEENDFYAIGMGVNQNQLAPDHTLVTAVKRIDNITYNEVKDIVEDTWTGGTKMSGIKEGIVGIDAAGSNVEIPQDIMDTVEDVRTALLAGEFEIPDRNQDIQSWVEENQNSK